MNKSIRKCKNAEIRYRLVLHRHARQINLKTHNQLLRFVCTVFVKNNSENLSINITFQHVLPERNMIDSTERLMVIKESTIMSTMVLQIKSRSNFNDNICSI